jgi:hypothetical protein
MGLTLVQRSPTECDVSECDLSECDVSECDVETSTMRRPRLFRHKKENRTMHDLILFKRDDV